jgi:hypothetical protein
MMIPAILEKLTFGGATAVLFTRGRIPDAHLSYARKLHMM